MSAPISPKLGYRPALDGIRALAILLVVGSHAHPTLLKGGELGVDVFFALSGFLITTLILEEVDRGDGRYGFVRFYARRALRLFPALYAMLFVSGIYLAIRWEKLPTFLLDAGVRDPEHRRLYGKFMLGAATYTTNLIGVLATPGNFLGHTWSLALEEQFYLIWPVVLVLFWRRHQVGMLMRLTVGFIGVCLTLRLAGVPADRGFLWMRPEAIAAGSLAALLRWNIPRVRPIVARYATLLTMIGLTVVGTVPLMKGRLIPDSYFNRGLVTLFGLMAAILILALIEARDGDVVGSALSLRPVVYLGQISYGLYVWHLPLFRFVGWEFPWLGGVANVVLKLAVSLAVAAVSFRYIEQPFRQRQARFRTVERSAGVAAARIGH